MKTFSTLLFLLIASVSLAAQSDSTKIYINTDEDGVAIHGYDPVSYFINDEPMKGKESLSYTYNGAIYHFSSQDNLDAFKADPAKYEPAYGGWCAYAIGNGYTADVNPMTYKILEGKLLLFYNKLFTNTLNKWNKDEENLYRSAEANWKDKSFEQ